MSHDSPRRVGRRFVRLDTEPPADLAPCRSSEWLGTGLVALSEAARERHVTDSDSSNSKAVDGARESEGKAADLSGLLAMGDATAESAGGGGEASGPSSTMDSAHGDRESAEASHGEEAASPTSLEKGSAESGIVGSSVQVRKPAERSVASGSPRPSLPSLTMENLDACPRDRDVLVLLRHSARGPLPRDGSSDQTPLTDEGFVLAELFGGAMANMAGLRLKSVHSSPVKRCSQTALSILTGMGMKCPVEITPHLTLPGLFLSNTRAAVDTWHTLGGEEVICRMAMSPPPPLPGMFPVDSAVRALVDEMFRMANPPGMEATVPGIHLFVTHDSLILPVAARFLGPPMGMKDWPAFLDGALLWKEQLPGGAVGVRCAYRERSGLCRWPEGQRVP